MVHDPDEEMLRDSIRRFVDKEMPREAMSAWAKAGVFPEAVFLKWAEMGWLALGQPEAFGGLPATPRQMVVLAEELARNGLDITGAYSTTVFLGAAIARHGSLEQKQAVLPSLVSGRAHLSTAITEPDTGSDISGVKCRATLEDGDWVIRGEKLYCSGAHLPNTTILVTCRTSRVEGNPRKYVEKSLELLELGLRHVGVVELGADALHKLGVDHPLDLAERVGLGSAPSRLRRGLGVGTGLRFQGALRLGDAIGQAHRVTSSTGSGNDAQGRPVARPWWGPLRDRAAWPTEAPLG